MSTQLEIDLMLNKYTTYLHKAEIDLIHDIWFTCIRMKLSCTFYPRTPIKSKIGGKILSQKHAKTNFYQQFSI